MKIKNKTWFFIILLGILSPAFSLAQSPAVLQSFFLDDFAISDTGTVYNFPADFIVTQVVAFNCVDITMWDFIDISPRNYFCDSLHSTEGILSPMAQNSLTLYSDVSE